MTREAFIRKWLGNKDKPYTEQFRDEMRADLDSLSLPPAEGAEEILLSHPYLKVMYDDTAGEVCMVEQAIWAMEKYATLHAQRIAEKMVEKNWININDRMPESGFCVLLYSKSAGVAEGAWSDSNGYFEQWRWSAVLSDVTHWMPLPNPPIE